MMFLFSFLFPLLGSANFQGEFCEPENEAFLLESKVRISKDSRSARITFVRSEKNGDETDVVLNEKRDFEMKISSVKNESKTVQKERCPEGHEANYSSGIADLSIELDFKDKEQLSKEIKKMIKDGKVKTTVACQWSAVENPCAEAK